MTTAVHSLQQLEIDYGPLDYALLSPIFDSISKAGYQAAFDHDDLSKCTATCNMPLMALGGETGSSTDGYVTHICCMVNNTQHAECLLCLACYMHTT